MAATPPDIVTAPEERSGTIKPPAHGGWTAILLAGQRPGIDPLADHYGAQYKALVQILGVSMLARVAQTLLNCPEIGRIIILAQDPRQLIQSDTQFLHEHPQVQLCESDGGIATSLSKVLSSAEAQWPIMVTTADHVLLTPHMVSEFLAATGDTDLVVGVGSRKIVEKRYPETKRTWLKFSDGHFSGANLFAFRGEQVLPVLARWAMIEQDRKKGAALIGHFGPLLFMQIISRTISLSAAMRRAGASLGITAKPVILSQPEAVIDVDKPADLMLVEDILRQRG